MKPNVFSADLGNVIPHPRIKCDIFAVDLSAYHGLDIKNPHEMWYCLNTDMPLLEIDVQSWLFLAYITGDIEIPTSEIMRKQNEKDIIDSMDVPMIRLAMDAYYRRAVGELCEENEEHWFNNGTDSRYIAEYEKYKKYNLRLLARNMCDCSYPLNIGTYEHLNEMGEQLVRNDVECCLGRFRLKPNVKSRNTYRDFDASEVKSIYSGKAPVLLRKLWLDLEESDYDDLLEKNLNGEKSENFTPFVVPLKECIERENKVMEGIPSSYD
uniref:Uncharacterized protein n=1 Tax=Corethron hystrix TaxID=216773 RepID=A0A7S1BI22_9STRA